MAYICELDIISFDFDGKIVWEISFMDIVANYEINSNYSFFWSSKNRS
ncbi:MAG: hypothetical protein FWF50_05120 [Defluviitaleaceae bacterium]|nr:hypothetical protein [Defluviitaleaceae bacterium]